MKEFASQEQQPASDMESALYFANHIENPCEVDVGAGERANIRAFWIARAREALETIHEPGAREFLETAIAKYRTET